MPVSKSTLRRASLDAVRRGVDRHRHQPAVERKIEEFLPVPPPAGLGAAAHRDLPSRAGVRKPSNVHFRRAGFVRCVGDPADIRREHPWISSADVSRTPCGSRAGASGKTRMSYVPRRLIWYRRNRPSSDQSVTSRPLSFELSTSRSPPLPSDAIWYRSRPPRRFDRKPDTGSIGRPDRAVGAGRIEKQPGRCAAGKIEDPDAVPSGRRVGLFHANPLLVRRQPGVMVVGPRRECADLACPPDRTRSGDCQRSRS